MTAVNYITDDEIGAWLYHVTKEAGMGQDMKEQAGRKYPTCSRVQQRAIEALDEREYGSIHTEIGWLTRQDVLRSDEHATYVLRALRDGACWSR